MKENVFLYEFRFPHTKAQKLVRKYKNSGLEICKNKTVFSKYQQTRSQASNKVGITTVNWYLFRCIKNEERWLEVVLTLIKNWELDNVFYSLKLERIQTFCCMPGWKNTFALLLHIVEWNAAVIRSDKVKCERGPDCLHCSSQSILPGYACICASHFWSLKVLLRSPNLFLRGKHWPLPVHICSFYKLYNFWVAES